MEDLPSIMSTIFVSPIYKGEDSIVARGHGLFTPHIDFDERERMAYQKMAEVTIENRYHGSNGVDCHLDYGRILVGKKEFLDAKKAIKEESTEFNYHAIVRVRSMPGNRLLPPELTNLFSSLKYTRSTEFPQESYVRKESESRSSWSEQLGLHR